MAGMLTLQTSGDLGPVNDSPQPLPTSGGRAGIGSVPVTGEGWFAGGVKVPGTTSISSASGQIARANFGSRIPEVKPISPVAPSSTLRAPPASVAQNAPAARQSRSDTSGDHSSSATVSPSPSVSSPAGQRAASPMASTLTRPVAFGQDPATQGMTIGLKNWDYSKPASSWDEPQVRDMMSAITTTRARTGASWDQLASQLQLEGVQPQDIYAVLRQAGMVTTPESARANAGMAMYSSQPGVPLLRPRAPMVTRTRTGGLGELIEASHVDEKGNPVDANGVRIGVPKQNILGQSLVDNQQILSGQPGGSPATYKVPSSVRIDSRGNVVNNPRGMLSRL